MKIKSNTPKEKYKTYKDKLTQLDSNNNYGEEGGEISEIVNKKRVF